MDYPQQSLLQGRHSKTYNDGLDSQCYAIKHEIPGPLHLLLLLLPLHCHGFDCLLEGLASHFWKEICNHYQTHPSSRSTPLHQKHHGPQLTTQPFCSFSDDFLSWTSLPPLILSSRHKSQVIVTSGKTIIITLWCRFVPCPIGPLSTKYAKNILMHIYACIDIRNKQSLRPFSFSAGPKTMHNSSIFASSSFSSFCLSLTLSASATLILSSRFAWTTQLKTREPSEHHQCCKSMQIQCSWRLFLPFLSFLGFDLYPFLEEQITSKHWLGTNDSTQVQPSIYCMIAEKRPKIQTHPNNQQSWSPALPSPFSFQLQSSLWFFPPSTSCRTATLENESKYLRVYT